MEESPLIKQYKSIKENYKEELLLFRMGDFYELFYEDAEIASRELGIVLTSKPVSKNQNIPMAGVPVKAVESYIKELLKKGYKIAICEQVEEGKKLFKREVVEVITPGTITLSSILKPDEISYIAAFYPQRGNIGAAFLDVSTGEFFITEIEKKEKLSLLNKIQPKELLVPEGYLEEDEKQIPLAYYDGSLYSIESAYKRLNEFFKTYNLDGFGIEKNYGIIAGVHLIDYIKAKRKNIENITRVKPFVLKNRVLMDRMTMRNLEILEKIHPEENGATLFEIVNRTKTPMGARLLRETLISPLTDREEIEKRLDMVEALLTHPFLRKSFSEILEEFCDLPRVLTRIMEGRAHPREVRKIGENMKLISKLKETLFLNAVQNNSIISNEIYETIHNFESLVSLGEKITKILVENPPILGEGSIIEKGISAELDEIREENLKGKKYLKEIEKMERERTGIPNLRIGYNSVFGYYIEVTKSYLDKVPREYIRKQTLINAERYITEGLKNIESKILGSEERIINLEREILKNIEREILQEKDKIQILSEKLALLDILVSFAEVSKENKYTKPEITCEKVLEIEDGRHPVVEKTTEDIFIPNDTFLNEDKFFWIITGPNMAGKSTYLRQTALICILAQSGCFVPAKRAKIGIVDKVFTRVGATDDLSRGVSTFFAEMSETANILNNAGEKSLILLDEIGRGTSTYDGLALAWAVSEEIVEKIKARTLFATHYHELTALQSTKQEIENYTVLVKEWKNQVIFLRKLQKGIQDKSYGIYVAKIAGLPLSVIKKAKKILEILEKKQIKRELKVPYSQGDLFESSFIMENLPEESELEKKLRSIDPDNLTPKEALEFLYELKKILGEKNKRQSESS